MRTTDIFLSGIGAYLPETTTIEEVVDQELHDPKKIAEQQGWTGVAIAGEVSAPEMALQASRQALEHWGKEPNALDFLVYTDCWHQGPDGWQPQLYLQHHLVGGDLLAIELRHGCNGVFSALEVASSYLTAAADRDAALIVASDNFGTPLINRWNAGPDFIASDAASAVVITKSPGFAQLRSVTSVTIPEVEEIHRGTEPMFPPSVTLGRSLNFTERLEAYRKKLFEEGVGHDFGITIYNKSKACIDQALSEAGVELDAIERVIITNSSKEESEIQFMGVLDLPLSKTTWDYTREIGHMGAGDHLISLQYLLSTGQLNPGDHVLLLGLAPGVTYSCAVVTILGSSPNTRPAIP